MVAIVLVWGRGLWDGVVVGGEEGGVFFGLGLVSFGVDCAFFWGWGGFGCGTDIGIAADCLMSFLFLF
jgi:hypothetical protein